MSALQPKPFICSGKFKDIFVRFLYFCLSITLLKSSLFSFGMKGFFNIDVRHRHIILVKPI
ncbi:hypothetical protein B7C51_20095 [Paenibacillus larvae subsp. pulvifaciens]|uniref:Uncharacterized protein n=1 Tax=Paenibacillus larvae subsp. pulvifaciens TaxID=1477 RepID=A0A1U9YR16_9BACL|nr:hypothetical protein BXP28_21620 [Paenibacillus larvae subsp. larvae]AQZ47877.1 hypothetical protein B5S25_16075 [Paenibacillus larvae subsp. pulvifaciens]ARF69633.1 hypothetical protein B7C51_20095 [Paenibacillus larvae subsp. pulvifaciens]MBH0341965.1 hypothetical protein [Paenibacillus larvae]